MLKIKIPKAFQLVDNFMLFIIATFPFLNIYATSIKGIGIADFFYFILLLFYSICLIKKRQILTAMGKCSILVILFVISNFLISLCNSGISIDTKAIFLRTMRFVIYQSVAIFFPITEVRRKKIRNIILFFSIVATFILILQNVVLRILGVYINAFIPGIPLMSSEGIEGQIYNIYNMGGRAFSFFSEPSSYAMYVGLCLLFITMETDRKEMFFTKGILTIGLLLSGATTGLACVLYVYGLEGLHYIFQKNLKISSKKLIILFIVFPIALIILFRSASVQTMLTRIRHMSSLFDRVEGYKVFFFNFNLFERFFGHGMNDNITEFFIPSYPRIYYYWGLTGMIFVMIIVYWLYKKLDYFSRIVILFVIFINTTTLWSWGQFMFVSYGLILSFPLRKTISKSKARG